MRIVVVYYRLFHIQAVDFRPVVCNRDIINASNTTFKIIIHVSSNSSTSPLRTPNTRLS